MQWQAAWERLFSAANNQGKRIDIPRARAQHDAAHLGHIHQGGHIRRIALLAVVAAFAALVATGAAQAEPGLHSPLTAVTGQGTGHVLVAPTAKDKGTFAVQVEVNIHDAAPNVTFAVARAADLNPDGVCTMVTGWLPLGDLTTSAGGAGAAHFEVHRGAPFVSGVRFDVVFRAVGNDGTELRSDCLTVTVK